MLPLLLFVPWAEQPGLVAIITVILAAAIAAAFGNWAIANAYNALPVGIANALSTGFLAIVATILGLFIFSEVLSFLQALLIVMILSGTTLLGFTKSTGTLPDGHNLKIGILNSLLFSVLLAVAFTLVGYASRRYHPFLVAYLWEVSIGLVTLAVIAARRLVNSRGLQKLPWRQGVKLGLACSPTAVGTGAFAYASSLGPVGIILAIASVGVVFNTLFARFLYGEKLTTLQWVILLYIGIVVAGLRLVST